MPRALDKTRDLPEKAAKGKPKEHKESNRDFVEQIVVAFILAFLVRGFEAEAFVIPTGSMAPTLMGRHKEITCRQCGTVYQVNASEEPERPTYSGQSRGPVETGICLNCRFRDDHLAEAPSFKGDRILVNKFLFSLPFLPGGGGPSRWDVVVFHYPGEPETNYIKRCVGLPGEFLRVYVGDILTRPEGDSGAFRMQRKPPAHQQAMQMLVWDDAHRPKAFADRPEWRRWSSKDWKEPADGRFEVKAGPGGTWQELRYRNLVPDPRQWEAVLTGRGQVGNPRPTLITDFYSYNSGELIWPDRQGERGNWYQPHWVGDLTLSCRLEARSGSGRVRLELIEGGVANRCEIDLATGLATLSRGGRALGEPVETRVKGEGVHDLTFANVDDRLTLWVDGRLPFGAGLEYEDDVEHHPIPTADDLAPAAVAVEGASAEVSGLVLKRDIYYTQNPGQPDFSGPPWDAWPSGPFDPADPYRRVVELFDRLADPARFNELGVLKPKDYLIRPGHYMMMGDNSPRSKDSRGWQSESDRDWNPNEREYWEVPESMLIGKAFFVYWPHGKPFGPDIRLSRDWRLPFRPYLERMSWIR